MKTFHFCLYTALFNYIIPYLYNIFCVYFLRMFTEVNKLFHISGFLSSWQLFNSNVEKYVNLSAQSDKAPTETFNGMTCFYEVRFLLRFSIHSQTKR